MTRIVIPRDVSLCLEQCGWTNDRVVDVTKCINSLAELGIPKPNHEILSLLESLYGLKIPTFDHPDRLNRAHWTGEGRSFTIDPVRGITEGGVEADEWNEVSRGVKRTFYPLGIEFPEHRTLAISDRGELFILASGAWYQRLGKDLESSFRNLLFFLHDSDFLDYED